MLPLEYRYKLTLAYEGTHYFGWQKTEEGPSIEEALEIALETVLQHPITLQAASRTDRGVHAEGQIVDFTSTKQCPDLYKWLISFNALLPLDIRIIKIEAVPLDFHPTLHVKSKTYTYEICSSPVQLPRNRLFSWHFHYPLDLAVMQKAAMYLTGTHDFASFCNAKKNEPYEHTVRTLYSVHVEPLVEQRVLITLTGDHFLYKMARNIAGALAYVGSGKLDPDTIPSILGKKDRKEAPVTAPAHGLTLKQVDY